MIIDFHTHIFPNEIAEKTIEKLSLISKMKAVSEGKLADLVRDTENNLSVVLPVATKANQVVSINDYWLKNKADNIIFFGAMHPDFEDYAQEIKRLKYLGIKGIKLHPDYQNTFIDDEKYINIINEAFKWDLIVVIHAGVDVGIQSEVKAPPKRIKNLLDKINNGILVLAHMGGFMMWDEIAILKDERVYLDTSFSTDYFWQDNIKVPLLNKEQFENIISLFGLDKILFGTDYPWMDKKRVVKFITSLGIKDEEKQNIFVNNAKKLLGI